MSHEPLNYAGASWIEKQMKWWYPDGEVMSPLGVDVANLLGELFYGIYHLHPHFLKRAEWTNDHHIFLTVGQKALSTYDYDELTRLVILAPAFKIRVSLQASTHDYMEWRFYRSEKHPSLDEAITKFNSNRVLAN